jgi:hypothetical protein
LHGQKFCSRFKWGRTQLAKKIQLRTLDPEQLNPLFIDISDLTILPSIPTPLFEECPLQDQSSCHRHHAQHSPSLPCPFAGKAALPGFSPQSSFALASSLTFSIEAWNEVVLAAVALFLPAAAAAGHLVTALEQSEDLIVG